VELVHPSYEPSGLMGSILGVQLDQHRPALFLVPLLLDFCLPNGTCLGLLKG
jgi:hypothetical protein